MRGMLAQAWGITANTIDETSVAVRNSAQGGLIGCLFREADSTIIGF